MCDSVPVFCVQAESRPRLRRPVSVPRARKFNDNRVHFWNYQDRELINDATRFHVTQVLPSQSARDLYEAPRFLLVDPHRSHFMKLWRPMVENMVHNGVPDDMSVQKRQSDISQET